MTNIVSCRAVTKSDLNISRCVYINFEIPKDSRKWKLRRHNQEFMFPLRIMAEQNINTILEDCELYIGNESSPHTGQWAFIKFQIAARS